MRIPNFVKKGRDRVKKWWGRLPKLPRRWRIVRNLAAAAVLAALVLVLLGWPSLRSYGAFRRAEACWLLTPSRLVLRMEDGRGEAFLSEGEDWITVGETYASSSSGPIQIDKYEAMLHQVLPKEGIVAVLLPAKNEDNGAVVAVWGAPPEAVSGTLELDLKDIEDYVHMDDMPGWKPTQALETFSAQAQRREDGWFVFQFAPHDNHKNQFCLMENLLWFGPVFSSDQMEQPYRLTLTDSQGKTAAEQAGTLPPDQRLQRYW